MLFILGEGFYFEGEEKGLNFFKLSSCGFHFFKIRLRSHCFELDSVISLGWVDLLDTVEQNRSASNMVNPTHPAAAARPNERLSVTCDKLNLFILLLFGVLKEAIRSKGICRGTL